MQVSPKVPLGEVLRIEGVLAVRTAMEARAPSRKERR
jgi:hypothetical protein